MTIDAHNQTKVPSETTETDDPRSIAQWLQVNARCFRDQHQNPKVSVDGLIYELGSKQLKAKIYDVAVGKFGTELASREMKDLVYSLEMRSRNGQQIKLNNRFARRGDSIMLDLGGSNCAVINEEGWNVCKNQEPTFRSFSHQRELPIPVAGSELELLFRHLSLEDPDKQLLVVAWLVSAMMPATVTPMILVTGEQGSGKTTFSKLLRSILDPSQIALLGDLDLRDWFLTFENHAMPVFENVGRFDSRMADIFCRAVTGAGIQRRMLYTNSETVIYQFHCPIIINGVNLPSQRPDFLDRILHLELKRHTRFRPSHEIWDEFQNDLPCILGSLLDLVSKVLGRIDSVESMGHSRLSDFVRIGRAVAMVLGRPADDFDKILQANQDSLLFDIGDSDPLVRAIQILVSQHPKVDAWNGTASKLLSDLQEQCRKQNTGISTSELPKDGTRLSGRLTELSTVLVKSNISFQRGKKDGRRFIELHLMPETTPSLATAEGGVS
jgi:energy-coupling factor transporter ATP-binding protein EcfA2